MAYDPSTTMNVGTATLDFGSPIGQQGDSAVVTVTEDWVKSTSRVTISLARTANADHEAEDSILEQVQAAVLNKRDGSFDIMGYAPLGTYGLIDVVWSGR